jgi:hypothetical protein
LAETVTSVFGGHIAASYGNGVAQDVDLRPAEFVSRWRFNCFGSGMSDILRIARRVM